MNVNSKIFDECLEYFKEKGKMSSSYLMRKYKLNFEYACKLSFAIKNHDRNNFIAKECKSKL